MTTVPRRRGSRVFVKPLYGLVMTMIGRSICAILVVCVLLQVANGRDCFGTLVYRAGAQMKAILVSSDDSRPPLPVAFPVTNCTGAFAIDGNSFVCIDSNFTLVSLYNLTTGSSEPEMTFPISRPSLDFQVDPDAPLFFNSRSKMLCVPKSPQIFCRKLEGGWAPLLFLANNPNVFFQERAASFMTGVPDMDSMTMRVMGNVTFGVDQVTSSVVNYLPEAERATWNSTGPYDALPTHLAMSHSGERTFIFRIPQQELTVCDPSTNPSGSLSCKATTLSSPAMSKIKLTLSSGVMLDSDQAPTTPCPAILTYFQSPLGTNRTTPRQRCSFREMHRKRGLCIALLLRKRKHLFWTPLIHVLDSHTTSI